MDTLLRMYAVLGVLPLEILGIILAAAYILHADYALLKKDAREGPVSIRPPEEVDPDPMTPCRITWIDGSTVDYQHLRRSMVDKLHLLSGVAKVEPLASGDFCYRGESHV